ncbi:MAG: hypothetical protein WAN93_00710, partial [Solirubrobacteraceae bacterium]
ADGTSTALGAGELTRADSALAGALAGELERSGSRAHYGRIVSTDLFYQRDDRRHHAWGEEGALAVEMEAAALFALGASAGVPVACVLAVSDTFDATGARRRIDDDALLSVVETMGTVAAAALAV